MILKKTKTSLMIWYCLLVFAIVSPWLVRAFIVTGNPVYPLFTPLLIETHISINPQGLFTLFTHASDPINPIYVFILPLVLLFKLKSKKIIFVTLYSFLSLIIWIFTPNIGGGRFILPYLPALSFTAAYIIYRLKSRFFTVLIILISLFTFFYRLAANAKFIPVILGWESKNEFLFTHLHFEFGDFIDIDHVLPNTPISVEGINNLFYITSPIMLQNEPANFLLSRGISSDWTPIYTNAKLNVILYKRP